MNIVILAAGQGKRMRSALPKVLHPLAGKPLLAHVVDAALSLSPQTVCVVYGHGGEQTPQAMRERYGDALCWALQKEQRGTGHALMQALPLLDASAATLVLYGDVPLIAPATLQQLLSAAGGDKLALLVADMDDPTGYGRIVRDAAGAVCGIVEEKDADAAQRAIGEINTGVLAAPTAALARWLPQLSNANAQGEYYLTDIVAMAAAEATPIATTRPQHGYEVDGVNSKAQLARLERIHQRNIAEQLLAAGVTLADPARIDVRGELICGADVFIDVNCVFEGVVRLGDGVHVAANCVLQDATVGPACVIGPFARLRPGTQLAQQAHVGNFVEVKNSTIGPRSKANHLSYLGDADIGADVNIGAGTITCNYDGAAKHRTVIEDEVFIGSDTQLVAPLRVGRGATIGAGTTLTRDAPPETLTLSRVEQKSVSGWRRPVKKGKG